MALGVDRGSARPWDGGPGLARLHQGTRVGDTPPHICGAIGNSDAARRGLGTHRSANRPHPSQFPRATGLCARPDGDRRSRVAHRLEPSTDGSGFMRSRVRRIATTWLVLAATAVLAAGCGSNAASASDAASEQAQARAFAAAVNLSASDIPGFKVALAGEGEHKASPGPLPRRVEQCDGGPRVNGASRGVTSPLLQKQSVPIETVLSAVYPMRDPSIASAYITAADSRQGLGCVQREEVRKRDAARLRGKSEVVALRPPLGGAPVFGVREWRCLPGSQPCKNRGDRSFTDRLWFAAGPYVVMLAYIAGPQNEAKGPQPLALPLERQLIALLYSRAQAHKS